MTRGVGLERLVQVPFGERGKIAGSRIGRDEETVEHHVVRELGRVAEAADQRFDVMAYGRAAPRWADNPSTVSDIISPAATATGALEGTVASHASRSASEVSWR